MWVSAPGIAPIEASVRSCTKKYITLNEFPYKFYTHTLAKVSKASTQVKIHLDKKEYYEELVRRELSKNLAVAIKPIPTVVMKIRLDKDEVAAINEYIKDKDVEEFIHDMVKQRDDSHLLNLTRALCIPQSVYIKVLYVIKRPNKPYEIVFL